MTIHLTHLACALLFLFAVARAHAQDTDPHAAEARALFERGVAAFDEGRHADALELFEESHALRPTPLVLYNIAVAERALGRTADAIRHLQQYIAEADPEDPRRELILSELEELGAERAEPPTPAEPPPREPPPREPPPPEEPPPPRPEETARAATVAPAPTMLAPPGTADPVPEGGSFFESPWLYVIAGALLLGGGAAAFFLLYDPPEEVDGNFDPPVVIALE